MPVQRLISTPLLKSFYRWREGGGYVQKQQSVLTVIFKLVIRGLISIILIVLGTVHLQFQGHFGPTSSRPVLGTVAAYVMAIV